MVNKTNRWWVATMWDMDYDYNALIAMGQVRYIVVGGLELAPNTGAEHKHCLLYTHNAKAINKTSFNWISKHINAKIHTWVKDAKGSELEIKAYSSKDGNLEEYGDRPAQGMRTDLEAVKDDIMKGKTVEDICVDSPILFHQYGRTLSKLEDIMLRKKFRTEMTKGIWYHGKTGVGKSHKAFEGFHPDSHYVFPNDNGWWDGYKGQETVIINEFRGGIPYSELLDLVDKYPKTVKRRNREPVPFLAKTVIITSSQTPGEVYNNLSETDSLSQLYRRFKIILLSKKSEVVYR